MATPETFFSPPTDPMEAVVASFENGHQFNGLASWFNIGNDERHDAVVDTVIAASQVEGGYVPQILEQPDSLTPQQRTVLKHFSLFTSPTIKKIFTSSEALTKDDELRLMQDNANDIMADYVDQAIAETGNKDISVEFDPDDTKSPKQHLKTFSTTDMGHLLQVLHGRLPDDGASFAYPGLMTPKHADLLLNQALVRGLPEHVTGLRSPLSEWMEQFLSGGIYPKAATIERLMDAHPAETTSNATFDHEGHEKPAGAWYFALVRRLTKVHVDPDAPSNDSYALKTASEYNEIADRTFTYLKSQPIMEQITTYIADDTAYNDVVFRPNRGRLDYDPSIVAVGSEGRQLKARQLAEVRDVIAANAYQREEWPNLY